MPQIAGFRIPYPVSGRGPRAALGAVLSSLIIAGCTGGSRAGLAAGPSPAGPGAEVDTLVLRDVSRRLASDDLQGRKTGTPGGEAAADYIAAACERLGLVPVSSEGYFQRVPLLESTVVGPETVVRILGPGVDTTFVHFEEFIPDVGTRRTLRDFAGDLVYVGRAPDILFRRSDLPPLEGKVALMRGEFGASGAAADTLMARGAVGVIQVVDDARRYRLFRATRGATRLSLDDDAIRSSFIPPLPAILAGPRMTVTLYQGLTGVSHGSWNDAYLNGLAAGLPSPQPLPGWRAEVTIRTTERRISARNVACLLPGRGASADTAVAVTAHHDHLGIGAPDLKGDSVYNGFSDNATGVAMALAIGDWFARDRAAGRGLRHSLVLLFPTGEEQGLLGADWFVTHPLWPLARLRGVVNLDANAPAGRPTAWRVAGDDADPLVRLVVAEARRQGWRADVAPPAPGSDYFPFQRHGVPAVFFVPSDGPYEGLSLSVSDSLRASVWARYHQPSDEYREGFPFTGLARYAEFARDVLRELDGAGVGRGMAAGRAQGRAGRSFTEPGASP